MEILEAIRSRRSIRRYLDRPVSREVIEHLLAAACWAPSAYGRQPWRWVVLTTPQAKERLAQALGERLRADRLSDGDVPERVAAAVERSFARITAAPIVIVAFMMVPGVPAPESRRGRVERAMTAQSVAAAVQNLLLAAHAIGLGACWVGMPLFCPEVVAQALETPPEWEVQAMILLGWPAETGVPAPRRPLAEVVEYRWGLYAK